jgi:hypothetical protein
VFPPLSLDASSTSGSAAPSSTLCARYAGGPWLAAGDGVAAGPAVCESLTVASRRRRALTSR